MQNRIGYSELLMLVATHVRADSGNFHRFPPMFWRVFWPNSSSSSSRARTLTQQRGRLVWVESCERKKSKNKRVFDDSSDAWATAFAGCRELQ